MLLLSKLSFLATPRGKKLGLMAAVVVSVCLWTFGAYTVGASAVRSEWAEEEARIELETQKRIVAYKAMVNNIQIENAQLKAELASRAVIDRQRVTSVQSDEIAGPATTEAIRILRERSVQ